MANLKGTYVAATVKALRAHREAALRVLPPELHSYLDDRVLSSRWYPEEEHIVLLGALVELSETGDSEPYAYFGRLAAQRDMLSTYSAFFRAGDPDATFERLGSVWKMGHDSGEMKATLNSSGAGVLELSGPGFRSPELCRLHTAFFGKTVEMAGGQGVRCQHTHCVTDGGALCRWEVGWNT